MVNTANVRYLSKTNTLALLRRGVLAWGDAETGDQRIKRRGKGYVIRFVSDQHREEALDFASRYCTQAQFTALLLAKAAQQSFFALLVGGCCHTITCLSIQSCQEAEHQKLVQYFEWAVGPFSFQQCVYFG